jgi:hypothetical protein
VRGYLKGMRVVATCNHLVTVVTVAGALPERLVSSLIALSAPSSWRLSPKLEKNKI